MALIVKSVVRDSTSSGPPISVSVRRLPEVSTETVPVMAEISPRLFRVVSFSDVAPVTSSVAAEMRQADVPRDRADVRVAARRGGVEAGHVLHRQQRRCAGARSTASRCGTRSVMVTCVTNAC